MNKKKKKKKKKINNGAKKGMSTKGLRRPLELNRISPKRLG